VTRDVDALDSHRDCSKRAQITARLVTVSDMQNSNLVKYALSPDEQQVLIRGVLEWGGSAQPTEEIALAMGFSGIVDLYDRRAYFLDALYESRALSRVDWVRVLLMTEVSFSSNVLGSGRDWTIVTGISDARTIELLRQIQSKISFAGIIGTEFGTRLSQKE
jgi:hypothetical protein